MSLNAVMYELGQIASTLAEIRDEMRDVRKDREAREAVARLNEHARWVGVQPFGAGDFFMSSDAFMAMRTNTADGKREPIAIVSAAEYQMLAEYKKNR